MGLGDNAAGGVRGARVLHIPGGKRSSTGQRIRHHLLGKGSKYNRALRRTEAKEGECRRLGTVRGKACSTSA